MEAKEMLAAAKGIPVLMRELPGEVLAFKTGRLDDDDVIPLLKPIVIDTIDKLDELFLKEPQWERYAMPKRLFFEQFDGKHTTNLRCHIARGMAQQGIIYGENLEEKIHWVKGYEFSEIEKSKIVTELSMLEPTVSDDQLYAWLGGDVVAPKDWANFAKLAQIDPHFERYYNIIDGKVVPDREMYRQYMEYNSIRSSMMRCSEHLKRILFLEPSKRNEMLKGMQSKCAESRENGLVAEGLGHILKNMPTDEFERSFEYITVAALKERMKKPGHSNSLSQRIEMTKKAIEEKKSRQQLSIKNPNELYQDFLVLTAMMGEFVSIYLMDGYEKELREVANNNGLKEFFRAASEKLMPNINITIENKGIDNFASAENAARDRYKNLVDKITESGIEGIDRKLGIDPSCSYSLTSLVSVASRLIKKLPIEFKRYLTYLHIIDDNKKGLYDCALSRKETSTIMKKMGELERTVIQKYGFRPENKFEFTVELKNHRQTMLQYGFPQLLEKWERYVRKMDTKKDMEMRIAGMKYDPLMPTETKSSIFYVKRG